MKPESAPGRHKIIGEILTYTEPGLKLAAQEMCDAIGNTFPLAQDCPPKIYKALLDLRREILSRPRAGGAE